MMPLVTVMRVVSAGQWLAQARPPGGTQNRSAEVLSWSLVLIGALIALFVAVAWFRRWMQGGDDDASPTGGFTLADLRELHRRGEMTDVEYEQARAQMLGQARADVAAVAAPGRREDQTGAAQPPADAPAPGAAGPTDKSTP